MNQIKIGKFISERRKSVKLTQMQLAERLQVTDRAVSKWECGRAMPDSSLMLELCEILKISVNDLLSGEVVTVDNYNSKLENNLVEIIKEKEASDRRLLAIEWVVGILSVLVLLLPIILAAYLPMENWQRIAVSLSGIIPALVGIAVSFKIEQVAGYYECKKCGHKHVPTYKASILAMHIGRTKYLRCPKCNERSWQKKVISKD